MIFITGDTHGVVFECGLPSTCSADLVPVGLSLESKLFYYVQNGG